MSQPIPNIDTGIDEFKTLKSLSKYPCIGEILYGKYLTSADRQGGGSARDTMRSASAASCRFELGARDALDDDPPVRGAVQAARQLAGHLPVQFFGCVLCLVVPSHPPSPASRFLIMTRESATTE